MFERKCKIIFVRHGATIYTEQDRLYDNDDYPPVNEKGRREMEKISQWLKTCNPNIDMIYTSSSLRAIQSARIISKSLKKDFEILDDIHERRAGIWGGLTFKQIEEKYPEMFEKYNKNPDSYWPEDGETIEDLNIRVEDILNPLVKKSFQKRLLIITHTGVIRSAVRQALCIPLEFQKRVYVPTGSATQINYYEEWSSLVYSAHIPV